MVEDLQITGAKTAKMMYGAQGWVMHHNTTPIGHVANVLAKSSNGVRLLRLTFVNETQIQCSEIERIHEVNK